MINYNFLLTDTGNVTSETDLATDPGQETETSQQRGGDPGTGNQQSVTGHVTENQWSVKAGSTRTKGRNCLRWKLLRRKLR